MSLFRPLFIFGFVSSGLCLPVAFRDTYMAFCYIMSRDYFAHGRSLGHSTDCKCLVLCHPFAGL